MDWALRRRGGVSRKTCMLKSHGSSSAPPVSLSFCWQLPVHLPDWEHEAFVRGSSWFTAIMPQKKESSVAFVLLCQV